MYQLWKFDLLILIKVVKNSPCLLFISKQTLQTDRANNEMSTKSDETQKTVFRKSELHFKKKRTMYVI